VRLQRIPFVGRVLRRIFGYMAGVIKRGGLVSVSHFG
jgi:hypothetical protein